MTKYVTQYLPLMRLLGLLAALLLCLATADAAQRVSAYTKKKLAAELPLLGLAVGDSVLLRTFKEESLLELWVKPSASDRYVLFRSYPICAYSGGLGPKRREGDQQTPEGFYAINKRRLQPYSRYHLALNIGYPNAFDRYHKRTGSLLMVHGSCDSRGCFAMGNAQIEEIYYLVEQALRHGQMTIPVHAFPFVMSQERLKHARGHRNYGFWQQLQKGYDYFQKYQRVPQVDVKAGKYIISGS